MVCPKCKETYEGAVCPKCGGPEIIVNNDDYLRRKKAYEEKQAVLKSASSDIGAFNKEKAEMTDEEKAFRAAARFLGSVKNGLHKAVKNHPKKVKKVCFGVLAAAAAIVLTAVGILAYRAYSDRNKGQIYYIKDGGIYRAGDANDASQSRVCGEKQAVFCYDESQFHESRTVEELSGKSLLQTMASVQGKYFAAAVYDEQNLSYSLFVWNQTECAEAVNKAACPVILYVGDDGRVIYRETVVVNDEGGTGASALCVYEFAAKGGQTVEENVRRAYIYSGLDSVVYLNADNELWLYQYVKQEKSMIAESVGALYGMERLCSGLYTDTAPIVNALADAKGIVYSVLNQYYYCALKRIDEKVCLGTHSGTVTQIVYNKAFAYVFYMNGTVWYAPIQKNTVWNFEKIAEAVSETKAFYYEGKKELLFTDQEGNLLCARGKKTRIVEEKITAGTVKAVCNDTKGFTYFRDGRLYYKSSTDAQEVLLEGAAEDAAELPEVIFCKNRLYYKGAGGQMYSCGIQGTDRNVVEGVARFVIAEE